jgi:hypothetical protein
MIGSHSYFNVAGPTSSEMNVPKTSAALQSENSFLGQTTEQNMSRIYSSIFPPI